MLTKNQIHSSLNTLNTNQIHFSLNTLNTLLRSHVCCSLQDPFYALGEIKRCLSLVRLLVEELLPAVQNTGLGSGEEFGDNFLQECTFSL